MGQLKALKRPTYLSVQSKQKDSASLMNLAALKMINNPWKCQTWVEKPVENLPHAFDKSK